MFSFISKFFQTPQATLQQYQKIVDEVHSFDTKMQKLSEKEFPKYTQKLRKRVASGESLDAVLPESFALVREAARRTIGLAHYDVQLLAGIAFHNGKIAEQKTGEGKTLSATLPLYLNALTGKGAHLVTVNDYLAQLGAGWMGPVYEYLGVSVGVIIHDKAYLYDSSFRSKEKGDDRLEHFRDVTRQEAYAADVTYGTNNEFGFDYLRDNMAQKLSSVVQRGHYFAIVDEADSILIDEARTPLIISAPDSEPTSRYYEYAKLVRILTKNQDYTIDEKMRTVALTDIGIKKIEKKLGIDNLYEQSFDTIHLVESSLKALTLFHRDKEYIVKDNEVIIVDEHTGRLMYGRRYSDGLHQAIEAKEGAKIQQESRTLATISLQNYFRLYEKLSGMSGTAMTESEEFHKIYGVDVLPIPTHRPVVRSDAQDIVYKTTHAKYNAIIEEVASLHKSKRPILLGTRSIEINQILSDMLEKKGIPHKVLNAKNHEEEAFIIAQAGAPAAVTVATNIAGRGVDIILGGAKPELRDYKTPKQYEKALDAWKKNHEEVVRLGGLHIIGTERHESRRIDNQLRGRAGRQGDPGSSRFYIALDDEIMRIFGGDTISRLMSALKMDESQPIEAGMVGRAIEQAQIKVEGFFFDQRKRLVDLDDVMNKQRDVIYKRRRKLLELMATPHQADNGSLPKSKEQMLGIIDGQIEELVTLRAPEDYSDEEIDAIVKEFLTIIPFDDASIQELRSQLLSKKDTASLIEILQNIAHLTYDQREEVVGHTLMRDMESYTILTTLDEHWMDHLDEMDNLRDGIWLRGDKQASESAYKKEAFEMFATLIQTIDATIARKIYRVHLSQAPNGVLPVNPMANSVAHHDTMTVGNATQSKTFTPKASAKSTKGSTSDLAQALAGAKGESAVSGAGVGAPKIGRNDPCPCGSGKKYKKCHGK